MINNKIREQLPEDAVVFDNHSNDNSIIGITLDGRVIYSIEAMIREFADEECCTDLEAIEWIEYNTVRTLPYAGDKAPLIVSTEVY